jgi:hypothetical protein
MLNVISGMMPEAVSDDMMMDDSFPGASMMIVSNTTMVNGASALFYPGVMDEIADKIGGDYVVLPSSTNELIVVPDQGDYKTLECMVKDINATTVDPKEQLSDHVYHYDSKEKLFERSDKFEARKAEKEKAPEKKSILSDLKAKKAQVEDMKKAAPAPAKAKKAEQAL